MHHLGGYTKNAEELITEFKLKYNVDIVQTGKAGKVNFYYLDTRKLISF
ncbi:MAG: hypothetical protein ACTSR5_07695 [Promethearchaeota archaeon]